MSELVVADVHVSFGGRAVLAGANLTVASGEIVGLLGPSGSGKSTLLRVIAGLITPDRGILRIDGVDVTEVPTHRRGVGMVFQDEQLFEHLDVAANVGFGLRIRGDSPPARHHRVADLLELVGLAGFDERDVRQLSGGEAKRVALARSLAPAPRVLLLDEPLTGLDRELHDRLAADLAGILRAERTTSLLVTHDRGETESIADRVIAIDELVANTPVSVESVGVEELYDLRMEVLRRDTPSDNVDFPHDRDPDTVHLAVRDESGAVIAASTWTPKPFPGRPDDAAVQLRGMAVDAQHQHRGLGAAMIVAGLEDARRRGATLVWANARDSALEFYVANGFAVVGDGFRTTDTDLPHHRIVQEL